MIICTYKKIKIQDKDELQQTSLMFDKLQLLYEGEEQEVMSPKLCTCVFCIISVNDPNGTS